MKMTRTRVSNETMYAEILNIKNDTTDIKKDHKELCAQVNTNRENIASQKSTIGIIKVFLTGIIISIFGFLWSNK